MKRLLFFLLVFVWVFPFTVHRSPFTAPEAHALDPVTDNITVQAGEDYSYTVTYKDEAGQPLNLTGYTFKAQLRAAYSDATPLAEFTIDYSQAAAGVIVITLPKATTATLAGRKGVWDMRHTEPAGTVGYVQRGTFAVNYTVTR